MKAIFPGARFIHMVREGRAVANSWLAVTWWRGWRGPENWRWGSLTPVHREKWERFDRSFVALAAIQWDILMTAHAEAARNLPATDLLEVRYEDLCHDPATMLGRVAEFAELKPSTTFEAKMHELRIESRNDKWQRDLSGSQQAVLQECLAETLQEYGYGQAG